MSDWSDLERATLAGRWRRAAIDPADLTLADSPCPHCVHKPAFDDVVVGPGYIGSFREDDALPTGEYPDATLVTCKCGKPHEQNQAGCGRSGNVPVNLPQ